MNLINPKRLNHLNLINLMKFLDPGEKMKGLLMEFIWFTNVIVVM